MAVEAIKKMMRTDMVLAKECATRLIVAMLPHLESQEAVLFEQFSTLISGDNPQYRIICGKYLYEVLQGIKCKEYQNIFLLMIIGPKDLYWAKWPNK